MRRITPEQRLQLIYDFIDFTMPNLPRAVAVTWLVLGAKTKLTWLASLSRNEIAERVGVTDTTIYRSLKSLEQAGLLTVVDRKRGRNERSAYRIHPISHCSPVGEQHCSPTADFTVHP